MQNADFQFATALKRLGADEELFHDLATYFIEDSPDLLQAAHAGLAEKNRDKVCRAAHTLRGLAANFDAEQAVSAAEALEKLALLEEWRQIPPALTRLEFEVRGLGDILSKLSIGSLSRTAPK
jgi:HPt (histidine-containing phosphotransfer) domain-containing protein